MYCRVIACDFDGTGAANGQMEPQVAAALGKAQAQGFATLLVTGRVLEDVQAACAELQMFDAVVAENGAIVWLCRLGRTIQLGTPPPERFFGELRAGGVPFHTGAVVVGTWDRHASQLLELIRRLGIDGQLIFNREALMLLPSGINKAVGVRRALEELGRSEHNLIAFGDAENDLPLLAAAEIGVAVRDSVPGVAAQADDRLSQPGGAGVAQCIHRLLEQKGMLKTPPRHRLVIGRGADGGPASLPCSGVNAVISGDPRSGKSWLAGLVAEQLVERGYRLCVIDPEGEYVPLGARSKVLPLGYDLALPPPAAVPRLFSDEPLSLILNLSSLPLKDQVAYVNEALAQLEGSRALSGIPQWILIDEAHYFFHDKSPAIRYLESRTGNFLLVTYRPSLLASDVYTHVAAHLVARTTIEEERYFLTKLLQARGPKDLVAHDALMKLEMPCAGLLIEDSAAPNWQAFTPCPRLTDHAHHARKYADTRLPDDKAFRFLHTEGPALVLAHNAVEFHNSVRTVPMASLRHHLTAGDFSRWVASVLGDEQLAGGLRKLERTTAAGAAPNRSEILAHIQDHYLIEEG
jgi:hydroxymethylpyrimidine pyrophosphatase-like HAD family hydrolase